MEFTHGTKDLVVGRIALAASPSLMLLVNFAIWAAILYGVFHYFGWRI